VLDELFEIFEYYLRDQRKSLIRRFFITPANIQDDYVWANSAYSGERFKQLLRASAIERNSIWSEIRALVEHVFGYFATSMGPPVSAKKSARIKETRRCNR